MCIHCCKRNQKQVESVQKSLDTRKLMIRSVPKITKQSMLKLDLNNPLEIEAFKKTAMSLGLTETFSEGALRELRDMKKQASRLDSQEGRFMEHLRTSLYKMASELGTSCPYSKQEMELFTETPENFQKAAMIEAQTIWAGLEDSLLKSGYDQSFTRGMLKQADEFSEAVGATPAPAGGLAEGLKKVYKSVKTQDGQATQNMSEVGSKLKGTLADTVSEVKEKAGPMADDLKDQAGKAWSKGKDAFKTLTSSLTPEDDRHQVIPGMGNQYLGAAGGALLSTLMGSQMGLSGPASWLVPLLGGAAGYHYLPKLMNMWKDQPGTGTKTIAPGAAAQNRANPIMGAPTPAAPTSPATPVTPITPPLQPAQ